MRIMMICNGSVVAARQIKNIFGCLKILSAKYDEAILIRCRGRVRSRRLAERFQISENDVIRVKARMLNVIDRLE